MIGDGTMARRPNGYTLADAYELFRRLRTRQDGTDSENVQLHGGGDRLAEGEIRSQEGAQ